MDAAIRPIAVGATLKDPVIGRQAAIVINVSGGCDARKGQKEKHSFEYGKHVIYPQHAKLELNYISIKQKNQLYFRLNLHAGLHPVWMAFG